jgi:hypothetical protein
MTIHHSANGLPNQRTMCGIEDPERSVDYDAFVKNKLKVRCWKCGDLIAKETERQRKWSI